MCHGVPRPCAPLPSCTANWQIFHNVNLAITEGTYSNQDGTTVHAPWKLAKCVEPHPVGPVVCLQKRVRTGKCGCEHSAFAMHTQTDPTLVTTMAKGGKRTSMFKCGTVSKDSTETYRIKAVPPEGGKPPPLGLPFTLASLLPIVRTRQTCTCQRSTRLR